MKRRLLLVDGTNFFFKGNWGTHDLTLNGESIKCLYSFHLNLPALIRKFEDNEWNLTVVVGWDGGYEERARISIEAVEAGIIPKSYKQERREARAQEDDEEKEKCNFIKQLSMAEELLSYTRICQVRIKGEEADDVIGSLCKSNLGKWDDIVIVTTDKDYYQLLWNGVRIYNSTRDEFYDKNILFEKYGLEKADQWIDVGALAGETGPSSDTIYGVPGIGTLTACKLIQQYKTLEGLLEFAESYFKDYLDKHGFEAFQARLISGEYKPSRIKEAKVLAYRERVRVAYKLKKMRTELQIEMPEPNPDWRRLEEFFHKTRFNVSQKNFDTLLRRVD